MRIRTTGVLLLCVLALGCGPTRQSSAQLARVAKDWCLAIRASQIIPVYPLTEDVQPGDVYLVQVPYETQIKVYQGRGFLPLENLVTRMYPEGYATFYRNRYGIADADSFPPGVWQFPSTDYARAPRAAFPTYGFSVSRSEGLNAAVPVQSIPVGLNLLNSSSAHGSVAIKKVYTFGMPVVDVQRQILQWADKDENRNFLRQFDKKDKKGRAAFLLRVVNRVYMTNEVAVSLFANEAFAGTGDVGMKRPVELLDISKKGAADAFAEVNRILNQPATQPTAAGAPAAPAPAAPPATQPASQPAPQPIVGASIKLTMASSRSVSLTETFDRPLVIGYLAFDLPILDDGKLGAPVSTQAQLERRDPAKGHSVRFGPDANSALIRAWLRQPGNREQFNDYVKTRLPRFDPAAHTAEIISGDRYERLRADVVDHFGIMADEPGRAPQ
jgi:hypothetical protein